MKRKKASSRPRVRILTSQASSSGVHERHELTLNSHRGILRNVADTRREAADNHRKNQFTQLDVPSTSGSAYMELDGEGYDSHDADWVDEPSAASDILSGSVRADLSHAGGEFGDLTGTGKCKRRREHRTSRRDQTHLRNEGFEKQMDAMVWAFMKWDEAVGRRGYKAGVPQHAFVGNDLQGSYKVQVIDCFDLRKGDQGIAAALLAQGLVPTAPYTPSSAFTVRTLELYRALHLRSPSLALQPFIKGLCDLQGIPFRRTYSDMFNNAYDLYLAILQEVEELVLRALGRSESVWRMKNACPCCTYRLEGEEKLRFGMLVTMDGGNSLRRLARCEIGGDVGADGMPVLGPMRGVRDDRKVSQRYYLTREEVNRWARPSDPSANPFAPEADAAFEEVEGEPSSPCASRWHNMSSESTAKMWGIFDETGIFLCLCRHGFVLVVSDMVQSGEQSKYPLATVDTLLNTFGSDIGCGYDIGCKFSSTVAHSELAPKAKEKNFTSLIGAFHGHAHNRLCQLSNLALYVKGMGLEDLEGCERMFSKSNQLAPSLRYTSPFHRQQKIEQFFKHMDSYETIANLSKFLVDNYEQALEILSEEDDLKRRMREHGISDEAVFLEWLEEERQYLAGLKDEPVDETLEMDYYQALVDLDANSTSLAEKRAKIHIYQPPAPPETGPPKTKGKRVRSPETELRHADELHKKSLATVMDLEVRLSIKERWKKGSAKWVAAADLVSKRRYQLCLDRLESLVVARVFELGKMNMAKTGYKLRTHISKSLQTRSQAIRTALERYNTAANAMKPRRQNLSWDQVVEYAFLADFDLLRDSRQDVRTRPWAQPGPRSIMHQHFKITRAREEIRRLNIEIRRLVTHIQDERAFLQHAEASILAPRTPVPGSPAPLDPSSSAPPDATEALRPTPAVLAHHVRQYARQRTLFFDLHLGRLEKLKSKVPVVAPFLIPGVPVNKALRAPLKGTNPVATSTSSSKVELVADDGSDESSGDEDDDREALVNDLDAVLARGD
ncbi:hypothetical protein DFP72DRAFT_1080863 [Ephemerocybe angulata]|uniref:CxC1-like cysteine cluster associated with KDZ transposases domain-containing protein n=1 Tax=Ephemerocybe angulata TaxID=980116 RepID=A0A8H6LVW1_9AGAR|nr:hypothetical protein DFP72DRAFT_1080863 [Tulosesus angulatus]